MKLIIAGSRDYILTTEDYAKLDAIPNVSEVVSGYAPGADTCGEKWASLNGFHIECFPVDWEMYGRAAAAFRDSQMAVYADAVAIFPGGTENMFQTAKTMKLKIYDFR